jgi:hypothetical protein
MGVTWDGKERRCNVECSQENRLERIEKVSDGTAAALAALVNTLTRIEASINGKIGTYDKHIDEGEKWRFWLMTSLATACIAGFAIAFSFGVWVSALQSTSDRSVKDIKTIETKLDYVFSHSIGVQRTLQGDKMP